MSDGVAKIPVIPSSPVRFPLRPAGKSVAAGIGPKMRERLATGDGCVHRGAPTGRLVGCDERGARHESKPVLACAVHGECTERVSVDRALKSCKNCPDKRAHPPREFLPGVLDPIPDPELRPVPAGWGKQPEVRDRHIEAFRRLRGVTFPPPAKCEGDGVVYVGGGKYWRLIVTGVKMLREVSDLPVQVWHRGAEEPVNPGDLAGIPNVEIIDASQVKPAPRILRGWEAKTIALAHCGWERILYLDADAYAVSDPQPLLDAVTPAVPFGFWVDLPHNAGDVKWEGFGIKNDRTVPQVQGGQLVIHRHGFWRELCIALWLNQHSGWSYSHSYGDQDQWRVALAATGSPFVCFGPSPWKHPAFVCTYGGADVIVHRCRGKGPPFQGPTGTLGPGSSLHLPKEREAAGYFTSPSPASSPARADSAG